MAVVPTLDFIFRQKYAIKELEDKKESIKKMPKRQQLDEINKIIKKYVVHVK